MAGEATDGRNGLRHAAHSARDQRFFGHPTPGEARDALASLASLVQDDVHVGRVLREIEMKDRLNRLRLLAGD